jgi:hypothetical protein
MQLRSSGIYVGRNHYDSSGHKPLPVTGSKASFQIMKNEINSVVPCQQMDLSKENQSSHSPPDRGDSSYFSSKAR